MRTTDDKIIQDALDKKVSLETFDGKESDAYHTLYQALATSRKESYLPEDFAETVVLKIEKKKNFKSNLALIGALLSALSILSVTSLGLIYYYPSFKADLLLIAEFKWTILFALSLVFIIQLMDWLLIKRKTLRVTNVRF